MPTQPRPGTGTGAGSGVQGRRSNCYGEVKLSSKFHAACNTETTAPEIPKLSTTMLPHHHIHDHDHDHA